MPGPVVSGVASLVIPGLGQLLNGKFLRGGVLTGGWILVSAITMTAAVGVFFLVHLVFIVASGIDAYRIAKASVTMT